MRIRTRGASRASRAAPRPSLSALRFTVIATALCVASSAGGEPLRYQLGGEVAGYADTDHVMVLTPSLSMAADQPTGGWKANASYLVDIVTAASVDIVSTASPRWTEVRHAGTLGADYQPENFGVSLGGSVSREPDYLSWYIGGSFRVEMYDKRFTPLIGYSYSNDTAGRKDTPFSVYSLELERNTIQLGAEIILNPSSRLTLSTEAVLEDGRQEKPYRYLPIFSADTAPNVPRGASVDAVNQLRLPGEMSERLPDTRRRYSVAGEFATRDGDHTLRVSERLYADTWGVRATTTDAIYVLGIGGGFRVWPHLRFHLQEGASFWQRAYVAQPSTGQISYPRLRTGDRELSPLLTATAGGGIEYATSEIPNTGWVFTGLVDVGRTSYFDALYIDSRTSLLVSLMAGHSL
ncbi:MAG: DUF3570 domain-containing protein [Polyangiaceae bacterium]